MKKQAFKIKSLMGLALTLISLIGLPSGLSAQMLIADGTTHTVEATTEAELYLGSSQNFEIPANGSFNSIHLTLKGGDGGYAKSTSKCKSNGGEGATTTAEFKIGTGVEELKPGGVIRFIVGKHGEDNSNYGSGAGGGGTAVLYHPPNSIDWIILAVAGGGGGAFQDSYFGACTSSQKGFGGRSTEYGKDGEGKYGGTGGKDGEGGDGGYDDRHCGGGGGGAYSDGNAGGMQGFPVGGHGDLKGGETAHETGGWGFGGGGAAGKAGGGGGGGYSGGGGGNNSENGGGGGSYVNTVYAYSHTKTEGQTGMGNSQHGQVSYYFLSTAPRPQIYKQVKFAYNTGKCIDAYGSHTNNGTNIQTFNCHSDANQWWFFDPTDRTIRSKLSTDKCLDLNQSNTANGSNIQLYDCNGSDAQHWVYNGLFKTVHSSVNSGKCWDATNGSASTNNANLQLWDCNYSSNNMKWVIDGATTVSNPANMKHIIPVLAPNFAVHSHTGAESGSNIQLWTKDNTNTAEQWYFDGLAIKMRDHQNLCIDLSQSNTSNGNNIQLYNCNGSNAQKWIYDGMTRSIRSVVNPGKCMQIEKNPDNVYGKRSNVDIQDCDGSDAQQFLIQE